MRLGDIPRLPSSVSGFVVEFTETEPPKMEGVIVKLPYDDDAKLYPLTGIQGFIYVTGGSDPCAYFVHNLNEMSQVIRVSDELLQDIEAEGEEAFLRSLGRKRKPSVIASAEDAFGGPGETLEIGNTFAYPLPWPWEMILDGKWDELGTRVWAKDGFVPESVQQGPVPGTQETFTGRRLFIQDTTHKFSSRRIPFWIASGEVSTAFRQRTVILKDPHIVAPSNLISLM